MINISDVFNTYIVPLWKIQLKNQVYKVAIWFTANLFRGKPDITDKIKVLPVLDLCKEILKNHPNDSEILRDSIWAIG